MIHPQSKQKRRGLTRIDLVVLLGATVLLVPLLAPTLRAVNEQASIAQCLGNLRGLMAANALYLDEYNGNLPPFVYRAITEYRYGGKTSNDYWKTASEGVFYSSVTERPLNPYLLGARVEPDVVENGQIVQRTEVPMLRCPSDRFCYQRVWGYRPPVDPTPISAYDDVGTSYDWNYWAIKGTNLEAQSPDYLFENGGVGAYALTRQLLRDTSANQPATFALYMEDPLLWAVHFDYHEDLQVVGYHGEWSKHSAGYLDGHATYMFMDTQHWCGPGWEALNAAWIRHLGQPRPVPISYNSTRRTCDP